MNRKPLFSLAAVAAAAVLAASGAQAALVVKDTSSVSNIPGLTGFTTTGAMMSGLSVRAVFSGGLDETLVWGTTGANAGGVTGTGWGVSVDGDTFTANIWDFTINPNANLGTLVRLVIDGASALTVLDTTAPNPGTPDSASGRDFAIDDAGFDAVAIATYSNVVSIGASPFVSDLFQTLTVTFATGASGPRSSFRFSQDTDNDSRLTVPEPTSLALAGLALAGLGAAGRRRAR